MMKMTIGPAKLGEPQWIDDDGGSKKEPHIGAKEPRLPIVMVMMMTMTLTMIIRHPQIYSLMQMLTLKNICTWPTQPEAWGMLFVYIMWSCLKALSSLCSYCSFCFN